MSNVVELPKQPERDYYSFAPILSHNAVYNFIVGARGVGKSYGAKVWAIRDYIKTGAQFIYLRRYNTELKTAKLTLFADIEHEFPDIEFRCMGDEIQMKRDRAWETMGYAVALSKSQQKKSVAYPLVTKIIFDEFIIERGAIHYMTSEARVFNDFYSTVDRYKDKTRVLFLANSVSIMNPYFIEYNIRPSDDEWIKSHGGFIVAHFPKSENFARQVLQTRFGQFISGTEYGDYAVGNNFRDNDDALIAGKPSNARYMCTIETDTGYFSLWIDFSGPFYYLQAKRPKQETIWTMLPERMTEDKTLIFRSDKILQQLRAGYSRGRVFFDSPQARNSFVGVFKK